jgi:outer membrane protein assembly factor BamB
MNSSKNPNSPSNVLQTIDQTLGSNQGNVLVYLIVVILIFGVLGVTIVSLFTTATSSTATPNDARRARYVTESAMRYAFSELRSAGFDTGVINTLNTTTYSVNPAGNFTLNIFAPWFVAAETYQFAGGGGALTLNVPVGKLPPGWMAKDPINMWVINYEYLEKDITPVRDPAVSWAQINATTLTLTVPGDFTVNKGERICFAVKPKQDQTDISAGGDLLVKEVARDFFPEYNGAISINRIHYVYEQQVHEPASNRVKLKNISAAGMPNAESASAFPLNVKIDEDFIVLSPRNYIVIPTGTTDSVSVEGTLDRAVNIYDSATVKPVTRSPDINLNQYDLATDLNAIGTTGFITADNEAQTIDIGSSVNSGKAEFGGIWFNTDTTIGGQTQVCNAGACEFGRGVRVFFRLDYSGTADGLTFALINAAHNTTSSIGGDINKGELLGYAGDSRTVVDPAEPTAASDFLDEIGAGLNPPSPGLHPPKIALEFDTYNNNSALAYCEADAIVDNNRNDPLTSHRDALQYVFWGLTSLVMPCRDYTISSTTVADHPTYDDNRHDTGDQELKWSYPTSDSVRTTPAVAPDGGTIYVGSDDHYLYAIDAADGSLKWKFDTEGKVISSPVVDSDGKVYVGSDGKAGHGRVYAFNPADRLNQPNGSTLNTSNEWLFYTPNNIDSSPAIGADGTVYIGDEQGHFYALYPDSRLADPNGDETSLNPANEWEFAHAGFSKTSKGRPAIGPALDVDPSGNRKRVYITSLDAADSTLYALDPADRLAGEAFPGPHEWSFDTGDASEFMPTADPNSGVIFTDEMGNEIRALFPNGNSKWVTVIGTDNFTPVIGKDGIVYATGITGSSTGKLTALNSTSGEIIWQFTDSDNLGDVRTTPAIAPDGSIYFGSDDGLLYAVNPDGTRKWTFPIPVDTNDSNGHSSPTVGNDGTVYIGSSSDFNLYAINNFTFPRNIKHQYVTSVSDAAGDTVGGEIVTLDDAINWLSEGPWAVRLEVMRSLSQNADLKYEYTLHAWIRQCATDACANIFGTFYEDTRIQYSATPHLAQTIELPQAQHNDFTSFIFGFTGATGQSASQSAVITDFKLSFIRFNDPIAP